MQKATRDLSIKLSRQKSRVLDLLKIEQRSEEEQAELEKLEGDAGISATELELRAALQAEPEPETRTEDTDTAEGRELRRLIEQANIGTIFTAAVERRSMDGAERELQQHYSLADNQIPLSMLETRDVTPPPDNVGRMQQELLRPVFADSAAAFLGVDMPTVSVGDAVYPVLTTRADVKGPYTDSTAATETTGAFTAEVLQPARLQASFFYRRTDRARFAGMDSALRENLSMALSEKLDAEVISGGEGLLTGTNLANNAAGAVTTFDNYVSEFGYSRVDGRYASSVGDIRVLMGSGTYAHAGATYRNPTSVDRTALDRLMQITAGVRVSAHVPAVTGNKQNSVIRLGMRRAMVAPMWEGVTLIPDEITKAATGEIVITAVLMHAVKILRTDDFRKQQTQHA